MEGFKNISKFFFVILFVCGFNSNINKHVSVESSSISNRKLIKNLESQLKLLKIINEKFDKSQQALMESNTNLLVYIHKLEKREKIDLEILLQLSKSRQNSYSLLYNSSLNKKLVYKNLLLERQEIVKSKKDKQVIKLLKELYEEWPKQRLFQILQNQEKELKKKKQHLFKSLGQTNKNNNFINLRNSREGQSNIESNNDKKSRQIDLREKKILEIYLRDFMIADRIKHFICLLTQ